ncbi:putative Myb DNA-binding protein [Elsinoe australis]|uniref:Putative Myb DNA-binding protein n=1 Tax=Elsinoe australis TaxID=40998 RepID=A0A4U7BCA4_9PEZI|nr:putative Myb DNA-binding protein [Elsinoe australis]
MSMPIQTSSAINKSGKVIAPKAAGRRRPAVRGPQPGPSPNPLLTPEPSQNTATEASAETSEPTSTATEAATSTEKTANPAAPAQQTTPESTQSRSTNHEAREISQGGNEPVPVARPTEVDTAGGAESNARHHEGTAPGREVATTLKQTPQESSAREAPVVRTQDAATTTPGPTRKRKAPAQVAGTKRKRAPAKPKISADRITAEDDDEIEPAETRATGMASDTANTESQVTQPSQGRKRGRKGDTTVPDSASEDQQGTEIAAPKSRKRGPYKKRAQPQAEPPTNADTTIDPALSGQGEVSQEPQQSGSQEAAVTEGAVNSQEAGQTTGAPRPRPRKQRQRKTNNITNPVTQAESENNQVETDQQNEGQQDAQPNENGQDEEEEEDPETMEIDVTKVSMSDLVRMPRGGKTSSLEHRMAEIDWDEVKRKRRMESPPRPNAQTGQDNNADDVANEETSAGRPAQNQRLRIVNGEIVFDETSAQIDRQAQALLDAENLTVNENVDLTKHVNRMSWINDKRRDPSDRKSVFKMKSDPWSDEETDRFYEALRMFGTDFFIISKMFPPKTRRQIKLKFVREERLDPARINLALSGAQSVPMDLKHYATASGVEESDFKDPTIVTAELKREEERQKKEIDERKKEAEEAQKQRDIMNEQREKEKEGRDKEKALQKEQREVARRRKRVGRGGQVMGTGTF